jgi:hypothetical protein
MNPIHKYNGGIGATLCNACRKIITTGMTDDLYCDVCAPIDLSYKYKLERIDDGLVKTGNNVIWIEWTEEGKFMKKHSEIGIRRSLVLDFAGHDYTWMTTTVKQIDDISENLITFKTENSSYKLTTYE